MRISRVFWAAIILGAIAVIVWRPILSRRPHPHRSSIPDRSVSSPLNQPGGGAAPDDSYAVYSALYQKTDEPLVFAQDSVTDIPQLNGSCLRPSTAEEREMVAAFEEANRQSHLWQQRFAIPSGYRLLTHDAAGNALACMSSHGEGGAGCQDLNGVKHIRYLGVPGFNRDHTRALVSVIRMCGSECGGGGVFAVEKTAAGWERAPDTAFTSECSWIY